MLPSPHTLRMGVISLILISIITSGSIHATMVGTSNSSTPTEITSTTSVSGVAMWGNGTGVANVTVIAVPHGSNPHRLMTGAYFRGVGSYPDIGLHAELATPPTPPGVITTQTNATGQFSLNLPPKTYAIRAVSESKDYISGVKNTTGKHNQSITLQSQSRLVADCFGCSEIGIDTVRTPSNTTVKINVTTTAIQVTNTTLNFSFNPQVLHITNVTAPNEFRITNQTINNEVGWIRVNQSRTAESHDALLLTLHARIRIDTDSESYILFGRSTSINVPNGWEVGRTTQGRVVVDSSLDRPQTECPSSAEGFDLSTLQSLIARWEGGEFSLKTVQYMINRWATENPLCRPDS